MKRPAAADAERDLVAAIRTELAAVEPARPCCREAERAGLGRAATGRAPSAAVARLAVRLDWSVGAGGRATEQSDSDASGFDLRSVADHCRVCWLRGRFLAQGSLSLGAGRTHLEFAIEAADARVLAPVLQQLGLPASIRVRRGVSVLTWKGAELILRFLRLAGASVSALELESRLVTRALRSDLNRIINAESANLRRQVEAARRQIQAIEWLEADGSLGGLSRLERDVARARRQAPEATFTDLGLQLGLNRSLVQRTLGRLEARAHGAHEDLAASR